MFVRPEDQHFSLSHSSEVTLRASARCCELWRSSPNVIDTFTPQSHLFFVLEFLNGGDLSFHLGQMGRFSSELARFYASELICGLRFLHKRGIIYR